jgi:hypothetical protein
MFVIVQMILGTMLPATARDEKQISVASSAVVGPRFASLFSFLLDKPLHR